jgi:glycerol-3-phosphate dehydrogenase (NAD(P)+)
MSERIGGDIAIVGAGAFGTALATVIARSRQALVLLVGRNAVQVAAINDRHRNEKALPGILLPGAIRATVNPEQVNVARRVLLAVPAQAQGDTVRLIRPHLAEGAELIICAKGMERTSRRFLSDVVAEAAPGHPVSVLSGPGFANDIARGLPTAMTIANRDARIAERSALVLSGDSFRLYASADVAGVEIGGALKNVLAIACGIVAGARLGQSARAALIARGLAELTRFAAVHGGRVETISGLSGLGDLVLTATSDQSRNYRYGMSLGEGARPAELNEPGKPLCEGAFTASVAAGVARARGVDMPITQAVAAIVEESITVGEAVSALMSRPLRPEGMDRSEP